ncbi:MAG: UDP-glucose dehydrogenase family protein [Gammaproteobacteria bacterium]
MNKPASLEVAVYGAGYVGLAASIAWAEAGLRVQCVEANPERLQKLQSFQMITDESIFQRAFEMVRAGNLSFTGSAAEAAAPVVFICVGTPSLEDGSADLRAVWQVGSDIARSLKGDTTVFMKSTVPPGTCDALENHMRTELQNIGSMQQASIEVVSNPEFMREGSAVQDFKEPDRVVIGANSDGARDVAQQLFHYLPGCRDRLLFMRRTSAELAKYGSNAFLATRIAMINDLALIADRYQADITEISAGIGSDHRIGPEFLRAGNGFGGSCFPKDLRALDHVSAGFLDSGLFQSVLTANEQHRLYPLQLAKNRFGDSLEGLKVAMLGVAFKAGVADTRDSPALFLAERLLSEGVQVSAYDPLLASSVHPGIEVASDPLSAVKGADMVVICTESAEFKQLDWAQLRAQMRQDFLVDAVNAIDQKQMQQQRIATLFDYRGIGRPKQ